MRCLARSCNLCNTARGGCADALLHGKQGGSACMWRGAQHAALSRLNVWGLQSVFGRRAETHLAVTARLKEQSKQFVLTMIYLQRCPMLRRWRGAQPAARSVFCVEDDKNVINGLLFAEPCHNVRKDLHYPRNLGASFRGAARATTWHHCLPRGQLPSASRCWRLQMQLRAAEGEFLRLRLEEQAMPPQGLEAESQAADFPKRRRPRE